MIKLETHCHVKGGSGCAHADADTLIEEYLRAGYGGITLTNHYCQVCYDIYPGDTKKEKLDFYFSLIDALKLRGEKQGLKVFYGAEVRALTPADRYEEYMLVGFSPAFFYDNKPLFYYTQEELFSLCERSGIFMYQTHPFRAKVDTGSPAFMHGAEAYNGHTGHIENNKKAKEFCEKHSLIKMSGSDYHDKGQQISGGVLLPDSINDEKSLARFYFSGKFDILSRDDLLKI